MRSCLSWLILALVLPSPSESTAQPVAVPALRYDLPAGFGSGGSDDVSTWIAEGLDGIIHVYPFRPFFGNFQGDFRRDLFRGRISFPYREDRPLEVPVFTALPVKGAEAAMMASFPSFNGGAPRAHLRVAILSHRRVALVDISANSPEAYERMWPDVSRLLTSLRVEYVIPRVKSPSPKPQGGLG